MRSARRGARMFGIEVKPAWQSKLQSCSGSLNVGDDFRVESLVSELLGAVACRPEPSQISPLWLRRVQEKLHAEFHARITIDELALEAGVHPVHLSRVFRRCMGKGIGDYVHRLRVRQACERMLAPEVSLADVRATSAAHFTQSQEPRRVLFVPC